MSFRDDLLEIAADKPTGLRWEMIGSPSGLRWERATELLNCRQLSNSKLSAALKERGESHGLIEFTTQEGDALGINGHRWDHIVQAGDSYFKPAGGDANRPAEGKELFNDKLAKALKEQNVFSAKEWAKFDICDLTYEHFIKSGESYFKPVSRPRSFVEVRPSLSCT
jgi:hypothetical protein